MRQPLWLLILVVVLGCSHPILSQTISGQDRDRGVMMLKAVRDDIRKNYYDPAFRGIDLEARTKLAEERIKLAKSNAEMFGIIAQMLLEFNDSHTVFLPPGRSARIEYGWQVQTFGDDCYVIAVKPKSDAEAQGLKLDSAADLVASIGDKVAAVATAATAAVNDEKTESSRRAMLKRRA